MQRKTLVSLVKLITKLVIWCTGREHKNMVARWVRDAQRAKRRPRNTRMCRKRRVLSLGADGVRVKKRRDRIHVRGIVIIASVVKTVKEKERSPKGILKSSC